MEYIAFIFFPSDLFYVFKNAHFLKIKIELQPTYTHHNFKLNFKMHINSKFDLQLKNFLCFTEK